MFVDVAVGIGVEVCVAVGRLVGVGVDVGRRPLITTGITAQPVGAGTAVA